MTKIKFPKIPPNNKVKFIMRVGDDQVACIIKKDCIIYYYWDQISLSWNKCDVYERIK